MSDTDSQAATATPARYYGRKEISEFLRSHGFPVPLRTLEKLASEGGGPPYRLFSRKALYDPAEALNWARSRLSAPRRHTSEASANAA